jgi:hypothetical protein
VDGAVMDHQCGGPAGRHGHDSRRGAKTCAPTAGREGNHPRWQPAEPLVTVPNLKWHRVDDSSSPEQDAPRMVSVDSLRHPVVRPC